MIYNFRFIRFTIIIIIIIWCIVVLY